MKKSDFFRLGGVGCLGAALLGAPACSSESSGTGGSPSGGGGQGGDTVGGGGAGGGGASGGSTGTAGGGAGGGTTTGTGGGPATGACPIDQFPEDKQVVHDSSSWNILDDTTWTKDKLYLVETELSVDALLTIEAGTTVCFGSDSFSSSFLGLDVGSFSGGGIQVQGTAEEHVTFTAIDPGKGWDGVHVSGDATAIDLAYVDFFYGSRSSGNGGNLFSTNAFRVSDGSLDPAMPTRLHHVTFAGAKRGAPLRVDADAGLTADSVVQVTAFDLSQQELQYVDSAVLFSPEAATSLKPGMISIAPEVPESKRGIELVGGTLSADAVIHALDLPYFFRGYLSISNENGVDPVKMTIEAGALLRLGPTAVIRAGSCFGGTDGDLIVDGTADKPVTLEYYPFPGAFTDHWGGLFFYCYDAAVSRVSHAILKSTGGNSDAEVSDACGDNSSMGAIVLDRPSGVAGSGFPGITIEHTTVDGSTKHGIVAECSFQACIDATVDYTAPELGNTFLNITGEPQVLSTCP